MSNHLEAETIKHAIDGLTFAVGWLTLVLGLGLSTIILAICQVRNKK